MYIHQQTGLDGRRVTVMYDCLSYLGLRLVTAYRERGCVGKGIEDVVSFKQCWDLRFSCRTTNALAEVEDQVPILFLARCQMTDEVLNAGNVDYTMPELAKGIVDRIYCHFIGQIGTIGL